MDVGFGLVLGAFGRCGEAVDKLGLWLLKPVDTMTLSGISYEFPLPLTYDQIHNTTYTNTQTPYSHAQTTAVEITLTLNCPTDLATGSQPGGQTWVPYIGLSDGNTAGWAFKIADLTGLTCSESDTSACTCTVSAPDMTSVTLTAGYYTGAYANGTCSAYATVSVSGASGFSFQLYGTATGRSNSPLIMTQTAAV